MPAVGVEDLPPLADLARRTERTGGNPEVAAGKKLNKVHCG
jgi:hypothetical protein